jgi:hypothetical protein
MNSRTELNQAIERINRQNGLHLRVGYAYGKPRIHNHDESVDVSPRLPAKELLNWLMGFEEGFRAAVDGRHFGPRVDGIIEFESKGNQQ